MSGDTLFPISEVHAPASVPPEGRAAPRLQVPVRNQVEMIVAALDALLPEDHQARVVWAFVDQQDLSALYDLIRATADRPGRTPIDPKLLMALWLNATLDGVGSGRELARRCEEELSYQWLCGGVSVNHHTLSDFRVEHGDFLDELLTRDVAAMLHEGLVELTRVAQDGMRVRASAGASSYRRAPTLEKCLEEAKAQVEALRKETQEEPEAGTRRERAARQRAARERQERVERALAKSAQIQAMKMGDGGFRPAANVELATAVGSQIITGVAVTARGSDLGEMPPMMEQHEQRYGAYPGTVLVDGGFAKKEDIETVSALGSTVIAPVSKPKKDAQRDRFEPLPGDSEAVASWRIRMGTAEAQELYKERASTAECVNAIARNRGLRQFTVRGLEKIRAVVLWYVLAHNLMRAHYLRLATA
jgi:transposase